MMDEQEKERRLRAMQKDQEYVLQLGGWLIQLGVQPPATIHGKMDAMLEMLVNLGIITEDQLMDMEEKYAAKVVTDLENTASQVRMQAMKQGVKLPPLPTKSGLIAPGG